MWHGRHCLVSNCRCMPVPLILCRRRCCPNDRNTWKWPHHIWHRYRPDRPANTRITQSSTFARNDEIDPMRTYQTTQNAGQVSAVLLSHQIVDQFVVVTRLLHCGGFLFNLRPKFVFISSEPKTQRSMSQMHLQLLATYSLRPAFLSLPLCAVSTHFRIQPFRS